MRQLIRFLSIILLLHTHVFAQTIIKGKLVISESNTPLPGVKISLIGSNLRTFSDTSGNFTLISQSTGKQNLEFSSKGFTTKNIEILVHKNASLDVGTIELSFDFANISLEELVNIRRTPASNRNFTLLFTPFYIIFQGVSQ